MLSGNAPVCMPKAAAMPKTAKNKTRGSMPWGGAKFLYENKILQGIFKKK